MDKLIITGSSDDLIEIDGCIRDEIGFYNSSEDKPIIISLPFGWKIKGYYGEGGIWRFEPIEPFLPNYTLEKGDVDADINDILTIDCNLSYLTYTTPDSKGVCGKIELNEKQQKSFDTLEEILTDSEFDDVKEVVKAVLVGIEF